MLSHVQRQRLIGTIVLLSAFLLFQIQPIAGKLILPWFGGGPTVWTTAMLFFQAALLVGYAYAHLIVQHFTPRTQTVVHALLLLTAGVTLAVFGLKLGDAWKPVNSNYLQWQVLIVLALSVGLPYTVLSATAPLAQAWVSRTTPGRSIYRLYALSNFGSLLALLSYPFLIEPWLGLRVQCAAWSIVFALFALLCAAGGWLTIPSSAAALAQSSFARETAVAIGTTTPSWWDRFFWLAFPACASSMLLAVTNYLCQDVAPTPLLWLVPLGLYLLSFILTFESDRWYRRWFWLMLLVGVSFIATWTRHDSRREILAQQLITQMSLLFIVAMVCHGETARRRPAARHLTGFYLSLSIGGVLGGLAVACAAPRIFNDFYELPLGTLATWLLVVLMLARDHAFGQKATRQGFGWAAVGLLAALLCLAEWNQFTSLHAELIASARNFFGALRVTETHPRNDLTMRMLLHGDIVHGSQMLGNLTVQQVPTEYYSHASGIGRLLAPQPGKLRHVGVIGLGTGTCAAYAAAGDQFSYYEINPQVVDFAERYFRYLGDARARGADLQIHLGDARLVLEHQPSQAFDVLAVDAFSGDAIPVHLLTREAMQTYVRHLAKPDGVLAFHISNRNIDLAPPTVAAALQFGLEPRYVHNSDQQAADVGASDWILLYQSASIAKRVGTPIRSGLNLTHANWTDDYSSLLWFFK